MSGESHDYDDGGALDFDTLIAYFAEGEKPRSRWRIGTEHEKIAVFTATGARIPYEGPHGVRALLERMATLDGWKPVFEGENVIALEKQSASVSLEPGGQVELSGAPLRTLYETRAELDAHLDLVKRIGNELGISFLALGCDPFHRIDEIPIMPKGRYAVMRRYLPTRGELGLHMMHATATVQANFDYRSEADMAAKMRTAFGVTPLISAIFANSSLAEGKPSGFASRRVEIWRHTDPDRCGLLPFVFDPDFGYRHYVEWALDVPMFFVKRGDRYLPARGMSFRRFMAEGFDGFTATPHDWEIHLTTVFPEIRLKRFIEVRGADAVPADLTCALPAIWKGILYDDDALARSWELVRRFSLEERRAAQADVARSGLAARIAGRPALAWASELAEIASDGLRRIAERGESDADERPLLEPVFRQLARGKSPGDEVLDHWQREWRGSRERLIDYARY